jgi:hypothetical protein
MAKEVIKKARILESRLPAINSVTEGYEVRYRVISEDKNRTSHWSPIFLVQPEFTYVPGTIHHTKAGDVSTVAWNSVEIKKGSTLIKEAMTYDVWVRWDRDDSGDWQYRSRVDTSSISLIRPETYTKNNLVQVSQPNRLSVEIYLKGFPISRDTNFLRVYQGGPWTV